MRSGRLARSGLAAAALFLAQGAGHAQGYGGYGGYALPDDDRARRYDRRDDDSPPPPPRFERRDDEDGPPPRYDRRDDDDRPRYRRPPPPDAEFDRPHRMACVLDDDERGCRTGPGRPGSPCRCPGGAIGHREPLD